METTAKIEESEAIAKLEATTEAILTALEDINQRLEDINRRLETVLANDRRA